MNTVEAIQQNIVHLPSDFSARTTNCKSMIQDSEFVKTKKAKDKILNLLPFLFYKMVGAR